MPQEEVPKLFEYFSVAFEGCTAAYVCGSTREVVETDSGLQFNLMITEVPPMLVRQNPGAVCVGSTIRESDFRVKDKGLLTLSQYGAFPNPEYDFNQVLQRNGAEGFDDWSADIPARWDAVERLVRYANFESFVMVVANGGEATKFAMRHVASHKLPNGVVPYIHLLPHTGRAALEFSEDPSFTSLEQVHVLGSDPMELRTHLTSEGVLTDNSTA